MQVHTFFLCCCVVFMWIFPVCFLPRTKENSCRWVVDFKLALHIKGIVHLKMKPRITCSATYPSTWTRVVELWRNRLWRGLFLNIREPDGTRLVVLKECTKKKDILKTQQQVSLQKSWSIFSRLSADLVVSPFTVVFLPNYARQTYHRTEECSWQQGT